MMGMESFWHRFPDVAERETRVVKLLQPYGKLPVDEYAFTEMYCVDPTCDCRRVLIQVRTSSNPNCVLATINFGWESEEFYTNWLRGDRQQAREIRGATLDPINPQSAYSNILLGIFQEVVRVDPNYVARLARHYQMFRDDVRHQHENPDTGADSAPAPVTQPKPEKNTPSALGIAVDRRERFAEVTTLIGQFGEVHLDAELTGFAFELWQRICRRKSPECMSGKPTIWAASVIHVIARMNFLFDRKQPVHLTFDTICNYFQANKTTVGGKATQIERMLRLRQHTEPGLCRRKFLEDFTNLRLSNGMIVPWSTAKQMGIIPPDARVEDVY